MIKKSVKKEIDKIIKEVWLTDICKEYGRGGLIKEASLQCSLYHHLQNKLGSLMKENNLFLYPECYFKELNYFADLAIVEMDMSNEAEYLWDRMTDVAAIIELKYDGGNSQATADYIKTDKAKLKTYVEELSYECQYYFGVIYETEFDESGKVLYSNKEFEPYLVKVSLKDLNIRKGPGTNYARTQFIPVGVYTIVEEADGKGATKWGRLKSGAGWISLDYVTKC